ncbi:GNAT family N-acetyltransferase [Cognatishimia sp. D5M38]|uniref:GNAT family N-acetyltransferase n=1 Tax=Cognatishimia coralii TaxID=3083254 RepID=A0ABU8QF82_9RHOB
MERTAPEPMPQAPTLETDRLILRPMELDDWSAYKKLMGSERAAYMGGPFSERDAWGMFCQDAGQWALFGHGALMMVEKATGDVVGQVGINHGPLFPEKELGWMLYEAAEGKGYAFEAAECMRRWAYEVLSIKGLVSYIDPENEKSQKLAERLGATRDDDAPRQAPEDLVYRHLTL